nr:hypothetical protein [Cochlodiniinecator piscidefendens]
MIGAVVRAVLVAVLIATPSLVLPNTSADTAQVVILAGLFCGALVLFEYASSYPSLIEFREAPPFNRIRFVSLLATVFLLSVICRSHVDGSALAKLVAAIGTLVGQAIDFPFSPVRLLLDVLPETASSSDIATFRALSGLAYLISLLTLAVFAIYMRLISWPSANRSFNVWVNLPTFDPTAGKDVVTRLTRDARVNILLGFLLPFLTPIALASGVELFGSISIASEQSLIWMVAAWAFLPASLFMRGMAMNRIAQMIQDKRRVSYEKAVAHGYVPA